jgi:hypothetical protein
MTYTVGQTIEAADYTNFRGVNATNVAYADDSAAANKLAALIGVGYGTRGYGQTSNVILAVSSNIAVTASQWNSLRDAMQTVNIHTGIGTTLPNVVVAGEAIQANNGTLGRPNVAAIINTLDTSRLTYDITQMTLSSVLTSTRSTAWNTSVLHEFTATFASEDTARYFFNTGGTVYVSASRSGGTVSQLNSDFTTLLSSFGTIKVGALDTTITGSGGTASAIGYYGLTGSYQTLYTKSGGGLPYYTTISYTLRARAESIVGSNGGNGSVIRFQAQFDTGLPSYDQVDGTLTSSVSQLLAGDILVVPPPTWATVTGV